MKARRLLKKITVNKYIFHRNEAEEAGVYGEAIAGSNFKSLFTLMLSRRQILRHVYIDEFLRALRSLGIKKR